jgi:hypothetical protein
LAFGRLQLPNRKRSTGECSYCGRVAELTDDHVPPRNLFPKPRPSNLITVPACRDCNKGFDLDDEYFRLAVTTGMDKDKFPREFDLSIQAINKLKEPSKIKFAKRMLASRIRKPLYTPAGIYLGDAPALEIEAARIVRTVSRIIRGLFFRHSGTRLPSASHTPVWSEWFGTDSSRDPEIMAAWKEIFEALRARPIHFLGEAVFRYSYLMDDEVPFGSAWWLSFYEHRNFVGITLGPDKDVSKSDVTAVPLNDASL